MTRHVRPRSTPPPPDWMAYADQPVPLSWADVPWLLKMAPVAALAVIGGIALITWFLSVVPE